MLAQHTTILQLGQYSSWITIDQVVQRVYEVQYSETGNGVSCWIASEAGKKFTVSWYDGFRDISLVAVVKIDGVVCDESVMLDAYNFPNKPNTLTVSCARTSEITRRDLEFSVIQVTDDDDYLHTLSNHYEFGTIEIQLWRMCITNVLEAQPLIHRYGKPTLEEQILHERSKKAGTHQVKFGDEYVVTPPLLDICYGYRMDSAPLVTMTFRYRPLSMLMAFGVVPRRPGERTVDEIRSLEARLQTLRSLERRKKKRKERRLVVVKREEESCEVIDLTM